MARAILKRSKVLLMDEVRVRRQTVSGDNWLIRVCAVSGDCEVTGVLMMCRRGEDTDRHLAQRGLCHR